MKKSLSYLFLMVLCLAGFQQVFALPLVFKKEVRVLDTQQSIVSGDDIYYELAVFDSTKYRQMRVAVKGYSSTENDIYFDAIEGKEPIFDWLFQTWSR